jgi:hypothetical protein
MKLNLTLISILLFIIIILIIFILNNNLEKFIVVKNTNNYITTDDISIPIPEIDHVCTGNDCTNILWHKDCNNKSYFDLECVERRDYIFNKGKTVSGRNCHLENNDSKCCKDQGGNGCDCDESGKTINDVGCGCGINKQSNGCCPGETDIGCGCGTNGKTINKKKDGCCETSSLLGCANGCEEDGRTCKQLPPPPPPPTILPPPTPAPTPAPGPNCDEKVFEFSMMNSMSFSCRDLLNIYINLVNVDRAYPSLLNLQKIISLSSLNITSILAQCNKICQ